MHAYRSGGYPIFRKYSVPWTVTGFGILCGLVGLLLIFSLGLFSSRSAYAFEVGGQSYPDSVADVTVTLKSTITAPPDSLTNQWFTVNMGVRGSQAAPTAEHLAISTTVAFENSNSVSSGNPWYFYANCGNSWTGVTYIPLGVDYAARFAYDGYANGWWGIYPAVQGPTVTFYSSGSGANASLYTNHDFIIWLVENSDYRTRYEGGQWITPTVAVVLNGIAWVVDEGNVEFSLRVDYRANSSDTWRTVYNPSPAPYSGSFLAEPSGQYRLVFEYELNGLQNSYIAGPYDITTAVSTVLSFGTYSVQQSNSNQVYIDVAVYNANSVKLQYRPNSSSAWQDLNVSFFQPDSNATSLWRSTPFIPIDGEYQLIAFDSSGFVTQYVGEISKPSSDVDGAVGGYISTLVQYISDFTNAVGDFFEWLPIEIRTILVSCIIIMIVLGLIGWLKN